jgi:hypothetical protein
VDGDLAQGALSSRLIPMPDFRVGQATGRRGYG